MKGLVKDVAQQGWFRRFLDVALPAVLTLIVVTDVVARRVTWWTAAFAVIVVLDVSLKVWKKR